MTDRWTDEGCKDRRTEKMLLWYSVTMRGSNVASLVGFCPVV